jgi:hypothetical protein
MRQKLCRRLEDLEKVSATTRQASQTAVDREAFHKRFLALMATIPPNPEREAWLKNQPPEYFHNSVQQLKALIAEKAARYRASQQAGGYR